MDQYNFVEKPPEDFFCPVTKELLKEPVYCYSCCGHHISSEAVKRLKEEGKPCPMCRNQQWNTVEDSFFKRRVMHLKVYCRRKSAGCDWVGSCSELDTHLNSKSAEDRCKFFECCGRIMQRGHFEEHQSECPKRPFTCEYCSFEATHKESKDHMLKCQSFPEICPNECSSTKIERKNLPRHLKECPLQELECMFSFAGCKEKRKRGRSMEEHLDSTKGEHLEMMASECKKMRSTLDACFSQNISSLTNGFSFVVDDFEELKRDDAEWFSAPFYYSGFKLCLGVSPNGVKKYRASHVSVYLYGMKGEFDLHLRWPTRNFHICVELVNNKETGQRLRVTKYLVLDRVAEDGARVQIPSSNVYSSNDIIVANSRGFHIPHSELYRPDEGKEYLINNSLRFRLSH
jgi:TNF receptor-associated factor 4